MIAHALKYDISCADRALFNAISLCKIYNMNFFSFLFIILLTSLTSSLIAQENYTEKIPETKVSFEMIFVKGGSFEMGLPDEHDWYEDQEGTPQTVKIPQSRYKCICYKNNEV